MLAFGESAVSGVWQTLLYAAFFFLAGVGVYRAQRYRLSRTRWRGIRGGLSDDSLRYGWAYVWTALLIPLTLGWIIPWRATRLQSMLTNRMHFGSKPLRFDATAEPLYLRFAGLWLGTLFILFVGGGAVSTYIGNLVQSGRLAPGMPLRNIDIAAILAILAASYLLYGIVSAWYRAGQINHFASHTHFEGATFKAQTTAKGLIWLAVSNFLISMLGFLAVLVVVTAVATMLGGVAARLAEGLTWSGTAQLSAPSAIPALIMLILATGFVLFSPITQARTTRYLVERLSIVGAVPLAGIGQGADPGLTRGEGLAQAFDIDAF
jgi:uncharacterized membrane protein YjgN (DUF898 family)